MQKRNLCCGPVSVRMSTCPSITLVYCIHMAEHIVKLLSWPSSPITLVFWLYAPIPNSKGNPFSAGTKYKGRENFATEIAVYLGNGMRYAHGCYVTLIGSRMRPIEWWYFQWPWWTLTRFSRSWQIWSHISKMVHLRDNVSMEH